MKFILLIILLNSCLFAGNEIIIKTTSEKISFELYGSDSVHFKVDTAIFKLRIHNYSDKKFFIVDPEVADLEPAIDFESNRMFIYYGGVFMCDFLYWYRLKVLEPGESLEIPILVNLKNLKPSKQFNSYFVEVSVGYFPYGKSYEYLTKKQYDSPMVYFKSTGDLIDFEVKHKSIDLCCMPIYINLKK